MLDQRYFANMHVIKVSRLPSRYAAKIDKIPLARFPQ